MVSLVQASNARVPKLITLSGMVTLARDALEKVKAGITTLEEMYRVVETEEDFGTSCPKCNHSLGAGFVMCPRCGHALAATCRACQKMVSPEWKFCPYCRQDFLKSVSGRSFA